jgi:hypothetical protein
MRSSLLFSVFSGWPAGPPRSGGAPMSPSVCGPAFWSAGIGVA